MAEIAVQGREDVAQNEPPNLTTDDAGIVRGDYSDAQRVVFAGLAICNSEHDVHCGLSIVIADRAPETIAATNDFPVRVDWLQRELQQGPSVAPDSGEILVIKDLAADNRWSDFGKMCVAALNLRSMVSVPISVGPSDRAMLNFYSSEASALDHLDLDAASGLARLAAPTLKLLISEFREPLMSAAQGDCSQVAVAIGTIIARYRVNSADAFDLLREASHHLRRALLGIAIDVVAEGRLPEGAIVRARRQRTAEPRLNQSMGKGDAAPPKVSKLPSDLDALKARVLGSPSIGGPQMWHHRSAR